MRSQAAETSTSLTSGLVATERVRVTFPAMRDRVPLRNTVEILHQLHRYYALASYAVVPGYAGSDRRPARSGRPLLWEDDELTVGSVRYGSQFAVVLEAVQPYTPLFLVWFLPLVARRGAEALKPWVEMREAVLDGRSRRERSAADTDRTHAEADLTRAQAELERVEVERLHAEIARYGIGTMALGDAHAFLRQAAGAVEAAPSVAASRSLVIQGGEGRRSRWLGHRREVSGDLERSARLLTALAGPAVVQADDPAE